MAAGDEGGHWARVRGAGRGCGRRRRRIPIRVATLVPARDTSQVAALEFLLLTLSEAAKARGDAFERLTKWYLEDSPAYGESMPRGRAVGGVAGALGAGR